MHLQAAEIETPGQEQTPLCRAGPRTGLWPLWGSPAGCQLCPPLSLLGQETALFPEDASGGGEERGGRGAGMCFGEDALEGAFFLEDALVMLSRGCF